jgi:hypothetical protein
MFNGIGRMHSRGRVLGRQQVDKPLEPKDWVSWFRARFPVGALETPFLLVTNFVDKSPRLRSQTEAIDDEYVRTRVYVGTAKLPFAVTQGLHVTLSPVTYVEVDRGNVLCVSSEPITLGDPFELRHVDPEQPLSDSQQVYVQMGLRAWAYKNLGIGTEVPEEKDMPTPYPVHLIFGHEDMQKFCVSSGPQLVLCYLHAWWNLGLKVELRPELAKMEENQRLRTALEIREAWNDYAHSHGDTQRKRRVLVSLLEKAYLMRMHEIPHLVDLTVVTPGETLNVAMCVTRLKEFLDKEMSK